MKTDTLQERAVNETSREAPIGDITSKTVDEKTLLNGIFAVIFDVDGTLVDSMGVWVKIDEIFLEKYRLTKPEGFYEGMEGKSFPETARYFLELFPALKQTEDELMREWIDMADDFYASLPLKSGAFDFILRLKKRGVKIGVATSGNRELSQTALKANGVSEYVDSMWTACEANAGKPDPAVYLSVARDLHVPPEKCLAFEDVPMGILAGKNAGMQVCAVEDEFSAPRKDEIRRLADYYIRDYDDIAKGYVQVL